MRFPRLISKLYLITCTCKHVNIWKNSQSAGYRYYLLLLYVHVDTDIGLNEFLRVFAMSSQIQSYLKSMQSSHSIHMHAPFYPCFVLRASKIGHLFSIFIFVCIVCYKWFNSNLKLSEWFGSTYIRFMLTNRWCRTNSNLQLYNLNLYRLSSANYQYNCKQLMLNLDGQFNLSLELVLC